MKFRSLWSALLCTALLPAAAAGFGDAGAVAQSQQDVPDQSQPRDYGQGSPDDRNWDNDSFFQALLQGPIFKGHGPGFRIGFRAGYEDGRMDIEDGRQWQFGYRFRNPDHYRLEFGDREDYLREYKQGYENGYRRGYAEQS